jgi:hypothetical protein
MISVQYVYRSVATGLLSNVIQVGSNHAESVISE